MKDEKFRHGSVRCRRCGQRFGIDRSSLPHFLYTLDDDHFAWPHATVDDPFRTDTLADFDDADADLVVAADDRELKAALQLDDGALRNEERSSARVGVDANSPELSGTQETLGVGKRRNEGDRARGYVH